MNKIIVLFVLSFFVFTSVDAQVKKKGSSKRGTTSSKRKTTKAPVVKEEFTKVKISTEFGDMIVRLYNKTPKHRDNFIKLASEHFFDSLLFHRVINSFMIQGGDPNSKNAPAGTMLGNGDVGYTIPAEFDSTLFHKKGALCAARTNNPEKASSGCQFYIVQGKKSSDAELDMMQMQNRVKYTSAQRMTYKMNGGTPFLDNNYTVFGEVESGMEVIDKIATVPTDGSNRPVTDVRMKVEVIEQPKNKDIK